MSNRDIPEKQDENGEGMGELDEASETFEDVYSEEDLRLDHIPDVKECREIKRKFKKDNFWPNVWHINDHGNVDLLSIGWNGAKIVKSWV